MLNVKGDPARASPPPPAPASCSDTVSSETPRRLPEDDPDVVPDVPTTGNNGGEGGEPSRAAVPVSLSSALLYLSSSRSRANLVCPEETEWAASASDRTVARGRSVLVVLLLGLAHDRVVHLPV